MAKDILIKRLSGNNTSVNRLSNWGIAANELPLKRYAEAKDLPKNDWHDEDGDEEYIPETLHFKSYEVEAKLSIKSDSIDELALNLRDFLDFVSGGEFAIYDPNSDIGRTRVRYLSYSDTAEFRCGHNDGRQYMVQFTVKLKVNDPITDITLNV